MPNIESTSFGSIVVDGKVYSYDIIILPNGEIKRRPLPKGTHVVCLEELEEIIKEKPKVIIIGTGQFGIAKVEEKVKEKAKAEGIKLIVERTPKAIISFNEIREKKAGLFHLTC